MEWNGFNMNTGMNAHALDMHNNSFERDKNIKGHTHEHLQPQSQEPSLAAHWIHKSTSRAYVGRGP